MFSGGRHDVDGVHSTQVSISYDELSGYTIQWLTTPAEHQCTWHTMVGTHHYIYTYIYIYIIHMYAYYVLCVMDCLWSWSSHCLSVHIQGKWVSKSGLSRSAITTVELDNRSRLPASILYCTLVATMSTTVLKRLSIVDWFHLRRWIHWWSWCLTR
jgi:hypothetical protein